MTERIGKVAEEHWQLLTKSLETMEQSAKIMRQVSDTISAAHSYRIYLLDKQGCIEAVESFSERNNHDAACVAGLVYEASNDVFSGYELWAADEPIASSQNDNARRQNKRRLEDAIKKHQDVVIDLEEKLQRAFACVNRSRKLLEVSSRLRDRMTSADAPRLRAHPKPESGSR